MPVRDDVLSSLPTASGDASSAMLPWLIAAAFFEPEAAALATASATATGDTAPSPAPVPTPCCAEGDKEGDKGGAHMGGEGDRGRGGGYSRVERAMQVGDWS